MYFKIKWIHTTNKFTKQITATVQAWTLITSKTISYLIIEKVDGMGIQFQRQGLKKWDIVCHNLFIWEIKLVHNYWIDMIIT
jgi:hypothetical protein